MAWKMYSWIEQLKKEIDISPPYKTTRIIKKRIVTKWVRSDAVGSKYVIKTTNYYL